MNKRRWIDCRIWLVGVLILALLIPANIPQTHAFATDNTGHEGITRAALGDVYRDLDNERLKFSEKAINEVMMANNFTDYTTGFGLLPGTAYYHFDDENLREGSQRLVDLRKEIIEALMQEHPDGSLARATLGRAFHTLQDFYAHSNWVDLQQAGRAPAINFGHDVLSDPSPLTQFCSRTNPGELVGSGLTDLTTGYYFIRPRGWLEQGILGKCAHGIGILPGIAKDDPGGLHDHAFNAARVASWKYVEDILEQPGIKGDVKRIRAFFGVRGTLAFAIDVSMSMRDEIASVKALAQRIVSLSNQIEDKPQNYVLVTFSDPIGVGNVYVTSNPDIFIKVLAGVDVINSNNDDCPEYSMHGVANAIEASSTESSIIVFTDASAKDAQMKGNVDRLAQDKNARISYLLSGSCSPIDPAYIQTAATTGGQAYRVEPTEILSTEHFISPQATGNFVSLLQAAGTFAGQPQTFSADIDSTITRAVFSVAVDSKQTLTLRRPSGQLVAPTDPGVTWTDLGSGWVVTITAPQAGRWSMSLAGSGAFSAAVNANSSLSFSSFDFVEQAQGRHEGLFAIAGQPVTGTAPLAKARVFGSVAAPLFSLVSATGSELQALAFAPQDTATFSDTFLGSVSLPAEPFRVMVRGKDASGASFQRLFPRLFQAQPLQVSLATPMSETDLTPGQTTTLSVTVKNLGAPDTFHVTVQDTLGASYVVEPSELALAQNATGVVQVDVAVPLRFDADTEFKLTAVASSISGTGIANSAFAGALLAPLSRVYLPALRNKTITTSKTYVDDFSNPASGWYQGEHDNARWAYRANQYEILLRDSDMWAGTAMFRQMPANHTVEADMQRRSGEKSQYGIVFGYRSWSDYYFFVVDPTTQMYAVWRRTSSLTQVIPWTASPSIRTGNAVNRLLVQRALSSGVQYTLFINGNKQNEFKVTSTATGIGLYAQNPPDGNIPTTLRYDNFRTTYQTSTGSTMMEPATGTSASGASGSNR